MLQVCKSQHNCCCASCYPAPGQPAEACFPWSPSGLKALYAAVILLLLQANTTDVPTWLALACCCC